MHTHQWNDDDELVVFRTCYSSLEAGLIRGVLENNEIPFVVSDGDPYNPQPSIRVPASRVEDAERALEEARKMGERMAEGGE
jgi:hypothetical protein